MMDSVTDTIRRFLKRRRMKVALKDLRASGELDEILRDANYELLPGDQGSDFVNVYRKGNVALGAELFSTLAMNKDEAVWWIVQHHHEDMAGADPSTPPGRSG